MPEHGHGSGTAPVITDMGSGRYDVDPVFLWMPGFWEVRVQVSDGTTDDIITFGFCIPD